MGAGVDFKPLGWAAGRLLGSTWFLGVVLLLLTWPVADLGPGPGLDNSFWTGLYLAAHRGLHFGTDIVATYGPLGFLRTPALYYTWPARLAVAYKVALQAGLCWTLLWSLRRTLPVPVAFLVALVAAGVVISVEVALVIVFIWGVDMLRTDGHSLVPRLFPPAAGALAGVEGLVKLNTGATVVLVGLLACLGRDRDRGRATGIFLGVFAATTAVCWFAAGQALSNVGDYLASARQLVSGWSTVMMLVEPGGSWELWAALLATVIVIYLTLEATSTPEQRTSRRVAMCLLWVVVGFSVFKEGFVRQEDVHMIVYFATAFGACVAYSWRRAQRVPLVLSLAVVGVAFFGATRLDPFDPIDSATDRVSAAYDTTHAMVSGRERDRIVRRARVRLARAYGFTPELLALVGRRSSQVLPAETGLIWLYELPWRPVPAFEPYYAYTTRLDDLDADALRGARSSERIVRAPGPAVDDRSPVFDAPAAMRAMLCHYVQLGAGGIWQVLGRVPNRCGTATPLGRVRARWGEVVHVPPARRPSAAVFVRIHGAGVSGVERLTTLLYRARTRTIVLDSGRAYRLVPETAADGTLLRVPPRVDYPSPFALGPNTSTVLVTKGKPGEPQPGGSLTYAFFELPVRGPGSRQP